MDVKEYINSGILEAYLGGELSHDEMLEVDRIANEYPLIKQELNELRESINSYGELTRQNVNQNILGSALKEIKEEERNQFITALNDDAEVKIKRVNVVPAWSIAASILLLISFGFNYLFYTQFIEAKGELEALQSTNSQMAGTIEQANQQLQYASLRIAHFLNEDNIHVRMDGLDLAPESFANVFWNKKTNSVFISVDNLPEPPHGHQYQLWAIKAGQAPIDAGIFDHSQLIQELKVIRGNVQAFAVTLEKEGGSPIATVDQTFVKGFLKKT